jgi:DNA polymerase-1
VLADMELRRHPGGRRGAVGAERRVQERKAAIEAEIHALAGRAFNIASTKQLGEVLFDELKLPVHQAHQDRLLHRRRGAGAPRPKHEIASAILRQRELAKLINTYTDGAAQRPSSPPTGRVHATFQQTTGASGRLISTDPDLQRTPVKTPEGKRIREAFIAAPGTCWSRPTGARSSSASWRISRASPGSSRPSATRSTCTARPPRSSSVAPRGGHEAEQRNVGKTVNFATIYGQGATALGQILGSRARGQTPTSTATSRPTAGAHLARSHHRRSRRPATSTTSSAAAATFPSSPWRPGHDRAAGERIAANTPIQGSAADLCKLAMLLIDRALRERKLGARCCSRSTTSWSSSVPRPMWTRWWCTTSRGPLGLDGRSTW